MATRGKTALETPRTLAGWPAWATYVPRTPILMSVIFAQELEREKYDCERQRQRQARRGDTT